MDASLNQGGAMQDFQNRNPLRRQTKEKPAAVQKKPLADQGRRIVPGVLFLLVLIMLLGVVVWHYSRFAKYLEFDFLTEESKTVSVDDSEIAFQRLLVRNRFPFVLTITARLCRVEGDEVFPHLTAIDTRYYSYVGTRSWYSGLFETHVTFVASGDGRFCVTDQSGTPLELLELPIKDADTDEKILWIDDPSPLTRLVSDLREGKLSGLSEVHEYRQEDFGKPMFISLPGGSTDNVLMITLTPRANYGR